MAIKKITKQFVVHVVAGRASPRPPLWPTLGQNGINIGLFVKDFNAKTADIAAQYPDRDVKVPVKISIYIDKSFDFEVLPPLTADMIKAKAGISKGSKEPNKWTIGQISMSEILTIVEIKKPVMNTKKTESILKSVMGTAKSLGIQIID